MLNLEKSTLFLYEYEMRKRRGHSVDILSYSMDTTPELYGIYIISVPNESFSGSTRPLTLLV